MFFFHRDDSLEQTCPIRHPKEVIGTCSLCRKSVCEECVGTKTNDKIICKFCLSDIKGENKEKNKPSFLIRILGFAPLPEPEALKLKEGEECHSGLHVEEVTGTCQICKKSICPACTSPKKLSDKSVCNSCFLTIFQVRDNVKLEEREKFRGGIKQFTKYSSKLFIIFLLIFTFLFGITSGILGFFHFLHPESFEQFNQSWANGNYTIIISKDLPNIFNEMGERFWYYWWKDDGWRMSYEDWKKEQLEDQNSANGE